MTHALLDRQPRYVRPLVSNFSGCDTWAVPLGRHDWSALICSLYPKGARVTRRKLVPWGHVRVCCRSSYHALDMNATSSWDFACKFGDYDGEASFDRHEDHVHNVVAMVMPNSCGPSDNHAELLCFGIPREPEDFVKQAVLAGHPRNLLQEAIDGPAGKVAECVLRGAETRRLLVDERIPAWKNVRELLKEENQATMNAGPPYIKQALGDKNVLVWRDILSSLGHQESELWCDLRDGFRLTGWMPVSGIFPKHLRPPSLSKDELLVQAAYKTPLTLSSIAGGSADDLAKAGWEETKSELKKGWIFLDEGYDPSAIVLSRRFGLAQGEKVRVIDDGKASGLNASCGLVERFALHGVDVIAASLIQLLKLAKGTPLQLRGKTYDLVSAYKQFPVHPEDRSFLRTGVLNTESGRAAVFGANVLSFGATGSVAGFSRVSSALWHAGVEGLAIPWLAYYDDFPVFAIEDETSTVECAVDGLFDVMGVDFARSGKKATSFSTEVSALGLIFDLTDFAKGEFVIRHTDRRSRELQETLRHHLSSDSLTPREAEVLRGRLPWTVYCDEGTFTSCSRRMCLIATA